MRVYIYIILMVHEHTKCHSLSFQARSTAARQLLRNAAPVRPNGGTTCAKVCHIPCCQGLFAPIAKGNIGQSQQATTHCQVWWFPDVAIQLVATKRNQSKFITPVFVGSCVSNLGSSRSPRSCSASTPRDSKSTRFPPPCLSWPHPGLIR